MRRVANMKIRLGTCMLIHTIMIVYKQIRTDSFHLEYENGPVSQKYSCDISSYVLNDTGKNLDMLDIRLFLNSRLYRSMFHCNKTSSYAFIEFAMTKPRFNLMDCLSYLPNMAPSDLF